jgi:uncharacterized membrane protein YgaE (UPF0421/DUF939 family)
MLGTSIGASGIAQGDALGLTLGDAALVRLNWVLVRLIKPLLVRLNRVLVLLNRCVVLLNWELVLLNRGLVRFNLRFNRVLVRFKGCWCVSINMFQPSSRSQRNQEKANAKFDKMMLQFTELMHAITQARTVNKTRTRLRSRWQGYPQKSNRIQESSPTPPDSTHHKAKRDAQQEAPTAEIVVGIRNAHQHLQHQRST